MSARKGSSFTMYIDEDLKLALNIIALKQKRNMADIIRDLIQNFVDENSDKL